MHVKNHRGNEHPVIKFRSVLRIGIFFKKNILSQKINWIQTFQMERNKKLFCSGRNQDIFGFRIFFSFGLKCLYPSYSQNMRQKKNSDCNTNFNDKLHNSMCKLCRNDCQKSLLLLKCALIDCYNQFVQMMFLARRQNVEIGLNYFARVKKSMRSS